MSACELTLKKIFNVSDAAVSDFRGSIRLFAFFSSTVCIFDLVLGITIKIQDINELVLVPVENAVSV